MYFILDGDIRWMTGKLDFPRTVEEMDQSSPSDRTPDRRICGPSEELAILYDAENGVLHKHGSIKDVRCIEAEWRKHFVDRGFQSIADALTIVSVPADQEGCDFLNRCIECSGHIMALIKKGELPGITPLDEPDRSSSGPSF